MSPFQNLLPIIIRQKAAYFHQNIRFFGKLQKLPPYQRITIPLISCCKLTLKQNEANAIIEKKVLCGKYKYNDVVLKYSKISYRG